MVSLEHAVIVRLKTHGHNFEVLVDPDKALEFKSEGKVDLSEVLAAQHVFKDSGSGDKASADVMKDVFGTSDEKVVAAEVVRKGELHLTTEQKRKMLEERTKQVAALIARNAINPQTKSPHPQTRILQAMDEAKVEVTISKSASEQMEKVLKALRPIIPIRIENVQVAIKIPAAYTGKIYEMLRKYGEIKKEEWVGSEQYCLIEIPGGVQDELYSKLNSLTHGEVKIKLI